MKRRDWLRTAISTSALVAAVPCANAQTPPPANQDTAKLTLATADAVADGSLGFFSAAEYKALEALAKALVPAFNGRPGAIEAGVPRFLDFLLSQSPAGRQSLYRRGLALYSATADPLAALSQPWTFEDPSDPLAQFLRAAKDDMLTATTNSREWAATNKSRAGAGTSYYYLPIE